jgi:hypothetical protein
MAMLILCSSKDGWATLIGDEVTLTHRYWAITENDPNYDYTLRTFLVEEGVGDLWYGSSSYTANIESNYIYFDFISTRPLYSEFNGSIDYFNGPVLFGLNDSSRGNLVDVIIDTNFPVGQAEYIDNRISFTQDSLSINFGGLVFYNNTYLNATLVFDKPASPNPVPEPATALLFGTGIIAITRVVFNRHRSLSQ